MTLKWIVIGFLSLLWLYLAGRLFTAGVLKSWLDLVKIKRTKTKEVANGNQEE